MATNWECARATGTWLNTVVPVDSITNDSAGVVTGMVRQNDFLIVRWRLAQSDACRSMYIRPSRNSAVSLAAYFLLSANPEVCRSHREDNSYLCDYNYHRASIRIFSENSRYVDFVAINCLGHLGTD